MKNKITIIFMVFMMLFVLTSCSKKDQNADSLLYAKGLEQINKMDMMAESKEYKEFLTSSDLTDVLSALGEEDYSTPNKVFKIMVPEESGFLVEISDLVTDLPKELQAELEKRALLSVPVSLNGLNGTKFIAATSMINTTNSFLCENLNENTIYIFIFDNEYSAVVSFIPEEEGIVFSSSYFVKLDSLKEISSAEDMSSWFSENLFFTGLEIELVDIP